MSEQKSVAQLEAELADARARERKERAVEQDRQRTLSERGRQRKQLKDELANRRLQIKRTMAWLNERTADADALETQIKEGFKDEKDSAAA